MLQSVEIDCLILCRLFLESNWKQQGIPNVITHFHLCFHPHKILLLQKLCQIDQKSYKVFIL